MDAHHEKMRELHAISALLAAYHRKTHATAGDRASEATADKAVVEHLRGAVENAQQREKLSNEELIIKNFSSFLNSSLKPLFRGTHAQQGGQTHARTASFKPAVRVGASPNTLSGYINLAKGIASPDLKRTTLWAGVRDEY